MEGYFEIIDDPICKKCSHECKTCLSSLNCESCHTFMKRLIPPDCLCEDGYFDNRFPICAKCSEKCLTCDLFADYCLTC